MTREELSLALAEALVTKGKGLLVKKHLRKQVYQLWGINC